jgi:hypothetical protein
MRQANFACRTHHEQSQKPSTQRTKFRMPDMPDLWQRGAPARCWHRSLSVVRQQHTGRAPGRVYKTAKATYDFFQPY